MSGNASSAAMLFGRTLRAAVVVAAVAAVTAVVAAAVVAAEENDFIEMSSTLLFVNTS